MDGDVILFTASGADAAEVGPRCHGPEGLREISPPGGRARRNPVRRHHRPGQPHARRAGAAAWVLRDGASGGRLLRPGSPRTPSGLALPAPQPDRLPPARPADPLAARCCCRPGTGPGRPGCPCCSTPTAARTPSGCWPWRTRSTPRSGSPSRASPSWSRTAGAPPAAARAGTGKSGIDFAGPVLDDQAEALREAAARCPDADTSRVAIRGWSFGGYLAALAVLRRPDVFHAAVAGAPVTLWQLYDTHYTERYLGLPDEQPHVYGENSLLADAPRGCGARCC